MAINLHKIFATCVFPSLALAFYFLELIILNTLKVLLVAWFIVFIILPLAFKFSYSLQNGIIFLNFISYPSHLDLSRPETLGLYATRHFRIKYEDDDKNEVSVAAWHVMPNHIVRRFHKHLQVDRKMLRTLTNDEHFNANNNTDDPAEYTYKVIEAIIGSNFDIHDANKRNFLYEEILRKTKDPIVIYLHGNTGTRANGHRIELYQIVRKLGYHVIAIDYRGFADSSDISPTEKGCVEDALATYKYVKNLTNSPIYIYGHSLGSGIGLHMLSDVSKSNIDNPKGVILESPFNNIRDEITKHPFSLPFRHLPWFESTILKPIYDNGFRFESDSFISEFRAPVMILHAEKDRVIPMELGYNLYRKALETRGKSWGPVEFHRFDSRFGHKYIVRAENFAALLDQFIKRYKDESY